MMNLFCSAFLVYTTKPFYMLVLKFRSDAVHSQFKNLHYNEVFNKSGPENIIARNILSRNRTISCKRLLVSLFLPCSLVYSRLHLYFATYYQMSTFQMTNKHLAKSVKKKKKWKQVFQQKQWSTLGIFEILTANFLS